MVPQDRGVLNGLTSMNPPKHGKPRKIVINYLAQDSQFRFGFEFRASEKQEPLEFLIPADGGIALMKALQALQARHNIPIPDHLRPRAGRPRLVVVKSDE